MVAKRAVVGVGPEVTGAEWAQKSVLAPVMELSADVPVSGRYYANCSTIAIEFVLRPLVSRIVPVLSMLALRYPVTTGILTVKLGFV